MYAVIESGSKQYKVEEGDVIEVELLGEEKSIAFKNVILVKDNESVKIGQPFIENCSVEGECLGEIKGPKVIAYKYKKRKNYHRKVGHRQKYSRVKIIKIRVG